MENDDEIDTDGPLWSRQQTNLKEDSSVSAPFTGKIALITGASCFLGFHIARIIHRTWTDVRLILFDSSTIPSVALRSIGAGSSVRVSVIHGSVLDPASLREAFPRVDVVFHCTEVPEASDRQNRLWMRDIIVEGTKNVVEACVECGVKCLVFSGSLSQVLTNKEIQHRIDETFPNPRREERAFKLYGESKSVAEELLLHANGRQCDNGSTLHTCSVRCPALYGENDTNFIPAAFWLAERFSGYYLPARSHALMETMYVGNAAWAHVCAAQALLASAEKVGGRAFFVGDDTPVETYSLFASRYLTALNYRIFPLKVPVFLLVLFATLVELVMIFVSLFFKWDNVPYHVSRESIRVLRISHSVNWDLARSELNYSPVYSWQTAYTNSMAYYRRYGRAVRPKRQ